MIPLGILGGGRRAMPAGGGLDLTYLGQYEWTATSPPTITIPSVPLGTAIDRTLLIVLGVNVATGGSPCVISVNGVPATIDVKSMPHVSAAVGRIRLPASETIGDIAITTGNSWRRSIGLYECPDVLQVRDIAYHFLNSGADISVGPLRTSDEGFALGAVANNQKTHSWVWEGLTSKDHEKDNESFASAFPTALGQIPTVRATTGTSGSWLGIAAASYEKFELEEGEVVRDWFNHADGIHTTADTGQTWATVTTPLSVLKGKLGRTGSTGGFVDIEVGTPNMEASFDCYFPAAWVCKAYIRHVEGTSGATDTGYYFQVSNTPRFEIVRVVNGTSEQIALTSTNTYVPNERLSFSAKEEVGGTRIMLKNSAGVVLANYLDSFEGRPNGTRFGFSLTNVAATIDNLVIKAI